MVGVFSLCENPGAPRQDSSPSPAALVCKQWIPGAGQVCRERTHTCTCVCIHIHTPVCIHGRAGAPMQSKTELFISAREFQDHTR